MKTFWIPVLIVRRTVFPVLCLGWLSMLFLSMGDLTESFPVSDSRQQFPKQENTGQTGQNGQNNRSQFPTQRRGSGTHWQTQPPMLDT